MAGEAIAQTKEEAHTKTLGAAAILATVASYGLAYFIQLSTPGGEGCPFLCAGTGKISGILDCPIHSGDGLAGA
ncbi:MAG: hypothetical protein AAB439_03180 [Patescibacteria group bacterium]